MRWVSESVFGERAPARKPPKKSRSRRSSKPGTVRLRLDDPREDERRRCRRELGDEPGLVLGHAEDDVGLLHVPDLGLAGLRAFRAHVAPLPAGRHELREPLESLEADRLGVEHAQRLRLGQAEVAVEALRVLLAAHDHDAVVEPALVEPVVPVDGWAHHLDSLT